MLQGNVRLRSKAPAWCLASVLLKRKQPQWFVRVLKGVPGSQVS